MFKCHWLIFLTYARRKLFWLTCTLLLAGLVLLLGPDDQHRAKLFGSDMPHLSFGFLIMYYFGSVIIHLKQQIASPRASLVPHYRPTHLTVAAFMLSPVILVAPLLISNGFHLPLLPLLSLNLAFCALLAWAVYRHSFASMMVALAFWFSPALPAVHLFLSGFLTAGSIPISLFFLGAATFGFVWLTYRLFRLSEDMPEYARSMDTGGWGSMAGLRSGRPSPQTNYQSRWQAFLAGPGERQLARLNTLSNPNLWQRLGRWRVVSMNHGSTLVLGSFMVLPQLVMDHFMGTGNLAFVRPFLYFFPTVAPLASLLRRRPMLGYESLRPLSRSGYLIEQALTVALQVVELWAVMVVTILIGVALMNRGLLRQPTLWVNLGESFLFQVLAVSTGFWMLRFRSPVLIIALAMLLGLSIPMGAIFLDRPIPLSRNGSLTLLAIALLILLLSLFILRDAYHRWLRTDLG